MLGEPAQRGTPTAPVKRRARAARESPAARPRAATVHRRAGSAFIASRARATCASWGCSLRCASRTSRRDPRRRVSIAQQHDLSGGAVHRMPEIETIGHARERRGHGPPPSLVAESSAAFTSRERSRRTRGSCVAAERLNRMFARATGQDYETIVRDTEKNFWMNAEGGLLLRPGSPHHRASRRAAGPRSPG
jgi:hypothetical protein